MIVIHILPNISRSKGNQTIKLGQLLERNIRNIFVEKSHRKYGGEISSRTFSGKLKLKIKIFRSIVQSFIQFVFIISQVRDYRNRLKLSSRPIAFTSY